MYVAIFKLMSTSVQCGNRPIKCDNLMVSGAVGFTVIMIHHLLSTDTVLPLETDHVYFEVIRRSSS